MSTVPPFGGVVWPDVVKTFMKYATPPTAQNVNQLLMSPLCAATTVSAGVACTDVVVCALLVEPVQDHAHVRASSLSARGKVAFNRIASQSSPEELPWCSGDGRPLRRARVGCGDVVG